MRILIVAAHPDDETLGASALMGAPHDTLVVHVTDGAPDDARWWPEGVADRDVYAQLRASEADRALALAGARRVALGMVDQEAVHGLSALTRAIAELVARHAPDRIITHAYEGGHPDHDAVACAVACAKRLAEGSEVWPEIWEMALYHGATGTLTIGELIDNAGSVRHALSTLELQRRRAMLACYGSQRATLEPFADLRHERYRIAPEYDFARPPHDGPLYYERMGFPIVGATWRAIAARDELTRHIQVR